MNFTLIFLVTLFRPSLLRVAFFRDTMLFSVTILKQRYSRKKQFSRSDKFLLDAMNLHYSIKVITATNFNFIPWWKLETLKEECMHTILEKRCTFEELIK